MLKVKNNKNTIFKIFCLSFVLFFLFSNISFSAGTGIWAGTKCAETSAEGGPEESCDFCDAIIVANNIIEMLMKYSLVIAGVMIVVGAFFIMTSAGSTKAIEKGKQTIKLSITGAVITLLSYLAVGTFLHILTGRADLPWNEIECGRESITSGGGTSTTTSTTTPTSTLYAKIANNGTLECAESRDYLQNRTPREGEIFREGQRLISEGFGIVLVFERGDCGTSIARRLDYDSLFYGYYCKYDDNGRGLCNRDRCPTTSANGASLVEKNCFIIRRDATTTPP
jgi:hypothetical protein